MDNLNETELELKKRCANLFGAVWISCNKPSYLDTINCIFQHDIEDVDEFETSTDARHDLALLEHLQWELAQKIEKLQIDYSSYDTADEQTNESICLITNTDFIHPTLATRMRIHDKSRYMFDVTRMVAYRLLAIEACENAQYLLALEHHEIATYFFNTVSEQILAPTPYQQHTNFLKDKVKDLAEDIWDRDKNNILLRRNVANLIVELLPNEKLSVDQVSKWLKEMDIVPLEIQKRVQNNDYGNDKSTKIARENLILEIIQIETQYFIEE